MYVWKTAKLPFGAAQAEQRRLLAAEKRRASKLEGSLKKVTNLYESRLVDVKAFKTALSNRDEQIKAAGVAARAQEESHARALDEAAEATTAMTRALIP